MILSYEKKNYNGRLIGTIRVFI